MQSIKSSRGWMCKKKKDMKSLDEKSPRLLASVSVREFFLRLNYTKKKRNYLPGKKIVFKIINDRHPWRAFSISNMYVEHAKGILFLNTHLRFNFLMFENFFLLCSITIDRLGDFKRNSIQKKTFELFIL